MLVKRPARGGAPDTVTDNHSQHTTWVAYLGLGWVVVFFAFHLYWYLGGSFASPGDLPDAPHALIAWMFSIIVAAAFPLGALVCLAMARGWSRGRLGPAVKGLVWVGCVLLLLRGAAGILDDLTRDRPAPERDHGALAQGDLGSCPSPMVRLGDRRVLPGRGAHLLGPRAAPPFGANPRP
jgi:hypothetical protein